MSDYDDIMNPIIAGDVKALEEIATIVDGFPTGIDDFINRHWIINAIDCGTCEVVEWMISRGAPVNLESAEAFPALHSAIGREKPDKYEIIELLIGAGTDVNQRGLNGYTPVHYAASLGDLRALNILKEAGADLLRRTNVDDYATPLEEAVSFAWPPDAICWLRTNTEQLSALDIPPPL